MQYGVSVGNMGKTKWKRWLLRIAAGAGGVLLVTLSVMLVCMITGTIDYHPYTPVVIGEVLFLALILVLAVAFR